jgi:hypothetical protein
MRIDPKSYQDLTAEIVQKLNEVNTDLATCKLSFSALKSQCSDLEQRLESAARSSAQLQRATHEKYDIPLERFLERFGAAASDWVLLQQFQALNASDPVN